MKKHAVLLFSSLMIFFIQCSKPDIEKQNFAQKVNFIAEPAHVSKLKITTLSTMLASQGIGEWGYSALVEADGKKILFDTGRKPETVLQNAEELGVDLSDVEDVFLSHNHGDHTGGLLALRKALKQSNPKAISKIHVAEGIFAQRINFGNRMLDMKQELEADGVEFFIYKSEFELFPGVWITGPIDRIHEEKNYGGNWKIATPDGSVVDNIPEDQSLAIHTEQGFVLVAGCGHAGVVNTLEQVQAKLYNKDIYAIIGGFHLVNASDQHLEWTAKHLKEFGVKNIIGSHCTGINALYTLKELLHLERGNAVVGSVGDNFTLAQGISPGIIAR